MAVMAVTLVVVIVMAAIISDGKIILKIDIWADVMDSPVDIPIADKEYYEARLKEIRRRIYDDFSEK